jgi:hypothetical protein
MHGRSAARDEQADPTPVAGAALGLALKTWERELSRLRAGYARWLDDEATSVLYDRIVEVEASIAHTSATTPAGLAAQIRAVIGASDEGSTLSDSALVGLRNAVAALERLARGHDMTKP